MVYYYSPIDGFDYQSESELNLYRIEFQIKKNIEDMDMENVQIQNRFAEIAEEMLIVISKAQKEIEAVRFKKLAEYKEEESE